MSWPQILSSLHGPEDCKNSSFFTRLRQTGYKWCMCFFYENVQSLKSWQAQFVFCGPALARNVGLHKDTSALLGGAGGRGEYI
jgi:hypothetical protein